ncbi:MAG: hypothetical protein LBP62_07595 [Clostridiales bacterium]|jgi:hypothetical protein|nr:hypothetical protein [Clostridiales bacterium]
MTYNPLAINICGAYFKNPANAAGGTFSFGTGNGRVCADGPVFDIREVLL